MTGTERSQNVKTKRKSNKGKSSETMKQNDVKKRKKERKEEL